MSQPHAAPGPPARPLAAPSPPLAPGEPGAVRGRPGCGWHGRRRLFPFPGLPLLLVLVWLAEGLGHGWRAGWLLWPLAWLALAAVGWRAWGWHRAARTPAAPGAARPEDPRIGRVDRLADALKAELATVPEALRALGQDPARTAEALRRACHGLVRREAELRASVDPADDARLAREREALEARVRSEPDAVVRGRLEAALAALDAQRHQRDEVRLAAERLAAEHLRLLYTLEGLRTQLLRLRSADAAQAGVAGAGLEQALQRLAEELEAVATSLEVVARDEGASRQD